jgi:hypothetical protein
LFAQSDFMRRQQHQRKEKNGCQFVTPRIWLKRGSFVAFNDCLVYRWWCHNYESVINLNKSPSSFSLSHNAKWNYYFSFSLLFRLAHSRSLACYSIPLKPYFLYPQTHKFPTIKKRNIECRKKREKTYRRRMNIKEKFLLPQMI